MKAYLNYGQDEDMIDHALEAAGIINEGDDFFDGNDDEDFATAPRITTRRPNQPTNEGSTMANSKTDTKALETTEATEPRSVENLTPNQQAHAIAVECFDTLTALFAADDFQTKGIAGFYFARGAEYQYQNSLNRLNDLEHKVQVMEDNGTDPASSELEKAALYAKREHENMERLGRMKAAATEAYFLATGEHWTSKPATPAKKEMTQAERVAAVIARHKR